MIILYSDLPNMHREASLMPEDRKLFMPASNPEDRLLQLEQKVHALEDEVKMLRQKSDALPSDSLFLRARESYDDAATQPPLDSPIIWMRGKNTATDPGYTHQILSLISDVNAERSYPWPLYVQLKSSHNEGDADGVTVRLIKSGNGWGTAYHAETFHDAGNGSTIGLNIETHKGKDEGRSIGLNLQSVDWQMDGSRRETTINEAINIQCSPKTQWLTGLHFEQETNGTRAIWIEGAWDVGIDTGSNCIRMNKGAELCFDETRRFYMKYNPDTNSIEFHNRNTTEDRVIFSIPGG